MANKIRTILIGDVHGCIDEFDELLKTLSYSAATDRIILLGDLINRGPDSIGVIRRSRELNLESVMGNHEHKFLKWQRSNYKPKKSLYTQFNNKDIEYMSKMPTYIEINNGLAVHAGLKPGIPVSKQSKDDLLYLRYFDDLGNFVSLKTIEQIGKEKAGAYFWTECWTGPSSVIYGHSVNSLTHPAMEEVKPNVFCYGLDTGCCFGGRLTALVWESKEVVQVNAKQNYCNGG